MIEFIARAGVVAFGVAGFLIVLVVISYAAVRLVKNFKRWFSGPWLL